MLSILVLVFLICWFWETPPYCLHWSSYHFRSNWCCHFLIIFYFIYFVCLLTLKCTFNKSYRVCMDLSFNERIVVDISFPFSSLCDGRQLRWDSHLYFYGKSLGFPYGYLFKSLYDPVWTPFGDLEQFP